MADPFDEFFARYPPEMQAISRKLRAMVKGAMPRAQEVLYARQNHIGYSFSGSMADRIVYICPMRQYVRLGFMRGTQLPDSGHRLVGEGKWLRHVKVRTVKEAGNPALKALVNAAGAYAAAHQKSRKA